MKINVVYNNQIEGYAEVLERVENSLISQGGDFQSYNIHSMANYGNFTFVIGGDGTILKAARFYSNTSTPVLGINIGRLGFLSQICTDEIEKAVKSVLNVNYSIEERTMLVSGKNIALNDFVIKGCDTSRTTKFYLEINEKPVCDYIADGLIISTPTGSTAYGLSAGGPVLYPTLDALIVVPICPHTLNVRPIVIPSNEKITIKTPDRLSTTVDGYVLKECTNQISIESAPNKAKLAFINDNGFYSVLRTKLQWGISPKRDL